MWSDIVQKTTTGAAPPGSTPTTPPRQKVRPKDLTATVNDDSVTLNWTAGYNPNYEFQNVLRRVPGTNWVRFPVALDADTYTDTTGESGTTYIYRIETIKTNEVNEITNHQKVTYP